MSTFLPHKANQGRNAVVAVADSITADILLKALKTRQFDTVTVVQDVAQILAALEHSSTAVDLLITDLRLAKGDAFQLISELASRRFPGAIIFLGEQAPVLLNCASDLAESRSLNVIGTFLRPLPLRAMLELLDEKLEDPTPAADAEAPEITDEVIARDIANWKIEAVFQPKVALASDEIVGFEALARWNHPEHGLIPPAYFLSRAEQSSLIEDLTAEMVNQSLDMLRDVVDFVPRARMSINLSGQSLQAPDLPDRLLDLVECYKFRPSQVIFEITETQLVRNRSIAISSVDRLGMMGFGLSLDDFGTGFSSLDRLKSMPFTELKVDRRFCHGASKRPQLQHILGNCLDLARTMGMTAVAEGVEAEADWNLVRDMGYDVVQGFCISRAIRARHLLEWIDVYCMEHPVPRVAAWLPRSARADQAISIGG